jgi:hypothetical protein
MSSCSQRAVPNQIPNVIFVLSIQLCNTWWINKPTCSLDQPEWLVSSLNNQQCEMNTLSWGSQEEYILGIMHHTCFRIGPDQISLLLLVKLNLLFYMLWVNLQCWDKSKKQALWMNMDQWYNISARLHACSIKINVRVESMSHKQRDILNMIGVIITIQIANIKEITDNMIWSDEPS